MKEISVKIELLKDDEDKNIRGACMPARATEGSSGYDLYAATWDTLRLDVGKVTLVPVGFKLEMPIGIEAQLRARSGLSTKSKINLINGIGTIDADYRGPVMVPLFNNGDMPYFVHNGDRIAQMVFMEVPKISLDITEKVCESDRNEGGFGSSGR